MQTDINSQSLKQTIKDALVELLHEEPDALRQLLTEALEDAAFVDAIREGQATDLIDRASVFELLEDRR
ncbi:hypothetical protein [Thiohalocapsa halophila]|jgi:DNA-binding protein YbaB